MTDTPTRRLRKSSTWVTVRPDFDRNLPSHVAEVIHKATEDLGYPKSFEIGAVQGEWMLDGDTVKPILAVFVSATH